MTAPVTARGEHVPSHAPLATVRSPRPGAPRLYLGHGVTDSAAALWAAHRHWASTYEVISVDARGHGASPGFSAQQLENPVDQMVEDLLDLLARDADGTPTVLVGHSMGGAVAAAAAARAPELVTALILEDPAWLTPAQAGAYRDGAAQLKAWTDEIAADPARALAENRAAYPAWDPAEACGWLQGKLQVDRDFLASGEVSPREPWAEIAARLRMPTLLLTTDGPDHLIEQEHLSQLKALGSTPISVMPIAGASHCIRRDRPAETLAACDAFLAEVIA